MPTSASGFSSLMWVATARSNGPARPRGLPQRSARPSRGHSSSCQGVVPLCNNSRRSEIIAMMPDCNAHGPVPSWREPSAVDVQQFFDTLIEVYVNADTERWLVMDTTQAELDYIATRAREVQLAMEAGSTGGMEDKATTAAEEEQLTLWAAATEEAGSADTGVPLVEDAADE